MLLFEKDNRKSAYLCWGVLICVGGGKLLLKDKQRQGRFADSLKKNHFVKLPTSSQDFQLFFVSVLGLVQGGVGEGCHRLRVRVSAQSRFTKRDSPFRSLSWLLRVRPKFLQSPTFRLQKMVNPKPISLTEKTFLGSGICLFEKKFFDIQKKN